MKAVMSEPPQGATCDVRAPTAVPAAADASSLLTIDELEARLTPDDLVLPLGLVKRQVGWGC